MLVFEKVAVLMMHVIMSFFSTRYNYISLFPHTPNSFSPFASTINSTGLVPEKLQVLAQWPTV